MTAAVRVEVFDLIAVGVFIKVERFSAVLERRSRVLRFPRRVGRVVRMLRIERTPPTAPDTPITDECEGDAQTRQDVRFQTDLRPRLRLERNLFVAELRIGNGNST